MKDNIFSWRHARTLLVVGAIIVLPSITTARSWVIPHVLETSGRITQQANSFDTRISMAHITPETMSSNNPVVVDLFLYDNAGLPMRAAGATVCNPCQFELTGNNRQLNVTIGDLINEAGGFDSSVKLGYAVLSVGDLDADRVAFEGSIMNSLDTIEKTSAFNFKPCPIEPTGETKRTFIVPHILEKEGSIANTQFTFDTTIFATYTPSSPGETGASVDLYLYDENGAAMVSKTGTAVCAPCTVALGDASARKVSLRMDDFINAKGGFESGELKTGFAILLAGGSDPDGVALQGFVVNSHTGPFDLSVFGFEPQPISAGAARTMVIPHVFETKGSGNFTFDTTIYATYTGGLADIPGGTTATASLYLYDNNGQPMQGSLGTAVCNPCTFDFSTTIRKQTIRMDDLITESGPWNGVKLGYGVIVVGGEDPGAVNLQGFVVNTHTSPFDLSVFGFEPQPLQAAARGGLPPTTRRTWVIPHILEKQGSIVNANSFDTTLYITYTSPPGTPLVGVTYADLYLFDAEGKMLRAAAGPVCAPCSYQFTGPNQKTSVSIESLVQAKGGFDVPVKVAHAIVLASGSDPDAVNLQGFVVNSHTSAFDLSVFGFSPTEINAAPRILPQPSVGPITGGQMLLQWHTNSPGYVVQTSGTLPSPDWDDEPIFPIIVGRNYQATLPTTSSNRFIRLTQP